MFEVGEGYRLATPTIHSNFSPMQLFPFFQNLESSYLVVVTSPEKSLAQPLASASEVYLNQHTVTHFRNEFRD